MHRANESLFESADGSMATAANGRVETRVEQHEPRIPLTPTGLLMEGHYTQNPPGTHFERNGDVTLTEDQPNPVNKRSLNGEDNATISVAMI